MPRNNEPLSAAQIHSVYASEAVHKNGVNGTETVRYAKTSAYKREPVPSGRSSLLADSSGKKKRY